MLNWSNANLQKDQNQKPTTVAKLQPIFGRRMISNPEEAEYIPRRLVYRKNNVQTSSSIQN
jgi:hypothetical protein